MKNFCSRHPYLIAGLLTLFLIVLALSLYIFGKINGFISASIVLLALVVFAAEIVFEKKWIWVCPICKKEALLQRNKYCSACGIKMVLNRKPKPILCSKGHQVDNTYKFCPKCGEHLR